MKHIIRVSLIAAVATILSGCALLQPKTNNDRLADVSGADFVLSTPDENVDLSTLPAISDGSGLMRQIQAKNSRLAYQSNGNRQPANITLTNPSNAIVTALSRYYVKEHQLRFIARGTIRNLDPAFINRALKKGDYVLDIRLTSLEMKVNADNQFYPQASYQLTVVDRERARNLISDTCSFAQPGNARPLSYFTAKNGANLSAFLQRFASPCLQYFAKGTAFAGQLDTTIKSAATPSKVDNSLTRISIDNAVRYYSDYQYDAIWLNSASAGISRVKPLTPTLAFEFSSAATVYDVNQYPTFGETSFYGGELSAGVNYFPQGDINRGYYLLLKGQTAQTRQNAVQLSTNALGVSAGAFRPLFWKLHVAADYTFWQHLGPTTDTNLQGHEASVSLRYQYR